jgi:hypothetical protein
MEDNPAATEQVTANQILAAASQVDAPEIPDPESVELLRVSEVQYLLRVLTGEGDVESVIVDL